MTAKVASKTDVFPKMIGIMTDLITMSATDKVVANIALAATTAYYRGVEDGTEPSIN